MFKHFSALLLTVVLVACLAGVTTATAPASPAPEQAVPEVQDEQANQPAPAAVVTAAGEQTDTINSSLCINEEPVSGSGMYFHKNVLYCSVRAFFTAALPECDVAWADGQVVVTGSTQAGEALTVTVRPGESFLTANGRCLYVAGGIQSVGGVTMAPVRVMTSVFGGKLAWDDAAGTAQVTLGDRLLESGDSFYNEQSLYLLSHLINAEAGNQPLLGKVAVGNVILNRVTSARFPNSIYDVIYAKNQFTVVKTGTFSRTPNATSITAAKLALEGVSVVPGALYFNRAGVSCWASRNCTLIATIGNHAFYG